jgi:DNA repair exonuclease SbcCD ATPase subunit
MITFESIKWKNFLSTGDQWTEIQLNNISSTLIVGTNGAGKSTMLDALCFGLFNKPFRKINRGQLVNSINEKGLKVEVCFSIGKDDYRVFRGAKPNLFEVYKNNKMVDQDAAAKDTQKYLEQSVLKLNYKSFTQVVILGSSTFVPFMQLGASVRREVIEDLLDIQIFSYMNTILKDRVRTQNTKNRDTIYLKDIAEERVLSQERLINSLKEINTNRKEEKQEKYDLNESKIKEKSKQKTSKKKKLKKLEDGCQGIETQRTLLQGLRDKQTENKTELKRLTKEIKFLESHDVCPTCTQVIGDGFKETRMSSLTTTGSGLTTDAESIEKNIDEILSAIDKIEKICEEMYSVRSEVSSLDRDILRLKKENLDIDTELKDLTSPKIDEENKILDRLNEELKIIQDDCALSNQTLDEYNIVGKLLKDSGIKKQIIKKYIPIFNGLINKYLHTMDFFVNFTLDEEFNEVIKSRFRDEFSYASFSEGEKQKIDLALLFTWREVARMKNSAATNLLILDEVFDSSLDASATGELLSILLKLGEGTNLFVISHKGDLLIDKFKRCLRFEKVNDFSKLLEEE